MDIRIGILHSPREITLELEDGATIESVKAEINAGIAAGGLVWLTDKKGRQSAFPADKLAYIELGDGEEQRIGFS